MILRFIRFLDNKIMLLIVAFALMILGGILPFSQSIKLFLMLAGTALICLAWLRDSIIWACTISKMIIWLLIAPFLISLMLIAYISVFWNEISYDTPFSIVFIVIFAFVWTFAAYKFEKKKIKAAMSFVNALTSTVLALSFIFYFGFGNSLISLDQNTLNELSSIGLNPASLLEIITKTLTLPYLLGGIWGLATLEILEAKGC